MAVIALCLSDAAAGARLASALDDDHRVLHSPDWRQLIGLVARHPVDLCVIDPYDPFRPISRQRLQRLRRKHPDLAIVVYADFDGRASDLLDLGRIQVDGILQASGHERRATIRKVVDRSLARSAAARVVRTLDGRIPPIGLECIGWAIEHAEDDPRVRDLATSMGTTPPALARDLRSQGLPSARALLVWGRLLQAARLLERRSTTVDTVAFRVGYATGGGLRRAIKRRCGYPPGELKERGGLAAALDVFEATLHHPDATRAASGRPTRRRWARQVGPGQR
jgi:AraC-like DNA-binding protein